MDDSREGPVTPPDEAPDEGREERPAEQHVERPEEPPQEPRDEPVVEAVVVTVGGGQAHAAAHRASWASTNWPWVLGLGVVAIIFGVVMLSHAFGTISGLLWLTGLFLLFMGVVQLVTMGRGGSRGTHLAGAAICILGGIVLLVWPDQTLTVVAVVAGITFLLWGILRIAAGLGEHREGGDVWGLASGIALAILGVIMMAWPSATITLVGILIGLVAIAWGVLTVVAALQLRKVGRQWQEAHRRPTHSAQ